jgi:hypothetical protein
MKTCYVKQWCSVCCLAPRPPVVHQEPRRILFLHHPSIRIKRCGTLGNG